jgi:hypothetical protein
MALQSSGAISMSQIKDEFGGTGSHALSEYRALAGLGVSGIPASGAISFSQFHGKSNQVTTSVWVSSGYNTTSWQYLDTLSIQWETGGNGNSFPASGYIDEYNRWVASHYGYSHGWAYGNNPVWYIAGYRFRKGGYFWSNQNGNQWRYRMLRDHEVTTWTDTSAYQTQTITAQIST